MGQIANQRRGGEEEEEVGVIPNWSELCLDLLPCVFKSLSFISLNRAKSVCSFWHSRSRDCVPAQNQIPWLILFPPKEEPNNKLLLFIPEDKEKVYKTRDLGVDFHQSRCVATYGSWLLMFDKDNPLRNLCILNFLTGEKIALPEYRSLLFKPCCLWIDNLTKKYLIVCATVLSTVFTKDGAKKWYEFPLLRKEEFVYNHKNQKLYAYHQNAAIKIWDFSGAIPHQDGSLDIFRYNNDDFPYMKNLHVLRTRMAVTVCGDVLIVACFKMQRDSKTWRFRIYKAKPAQKRKWVRVHSLGDEALILDMGMTVVAKDSPGIKRNSVYFSGLDPECCQCHSRDTNNIFVYDLTTQKMEPLPQCVFSSIQFHDARWFFPEF